MGIDERWAGIFARLDPEQQAEVDKILMNVGFPSSLVSETHRLWQHKCSLSAG